MYVRLLKLFFYIILSWILLNIVADIIIYTKKKIFPTNIITQKYGKNILKNAYPELNESEMNELLNNIWGRKNEFDDFAGFTEKKHQSRFVNIDENGYRITNNEKLPIDTNHYTIFMLGGSHLFGYGVKDNQTIPYYLHKKLTQKMKTKKISIYNFGCAFYYSDQERSRLIHLLSQNQMPKKVIFLNGLNEFYFEKPYHHQKLKNLMAENMTTIGEIWWNTFPLMRKKQNNHSEKINNMSIQKIIQRYKNNVKLVENICKSYQIDFLNVVQPIPFYEYNLQYHLFLTKNEPFIEKGYKAMQLFINEPPFLNLSNLQKNKNQNFYIDRVHYMPAMNELIATKIADYINL